MVCSLSETEAAGTFDTATSGTRTVFASGDYDLASRAELARLLDLGCATYPSMLVLDCSKVTFLDAGSVGLIVTARKRQRQHGGGLRIANAHGIVARVFSLCGLGELVTEPAGQS